MVIEVSERRYLQAGLRRYFLFSSATATRIDAVSLLDPHPIFIPDISSFVSYARYTHFYMLCPLYPLLNVMPVISTIKCYARYIRHYILCPLYPLLNVMLVI